VPVLPFVHIRACFALNERTAGSRGALAPETSILSSGASGRSWAAQKMDFNALTFRFAPKFAYQWDRSAAER